MLRWLNGVRLCAFILILSLPPAARAGLEITAAPTPLAPPVGHSSVLVHHAKDDPGGNTSFRFITTRKVDANKYPTNGVTVFARAEREQPQRDRDLGQTFLSGAQRAKLDALFLRIGHGDIAVLDGAPGARVAVQWFEVTGQPRLNDHGTPGFAGRFDRATSPELDDYLEGETYTSLRVIEGRLPDTLQKGDYLKLDFTGDDELTLEPHRTYGFLLMFLARGAQRGMTLANQYYGSYTPDPANKFAGHGIRREGTPAFPEDWQARLTQAPGTLGFPDVCTFRDLHFVVTVKHDAPPERAASDERRDIEGWDVFIRRKLLEDEPRLTERVLELLGGQLAEIARVVPAAAVKELRKVPLYFSPEYPGRAPTAEFHPDVGWLKAHGRDPAMAKAVEFTNVRQFEAELDRMPNLVLHELAHAYHDRALPNGFANPEIKAAFEQAKASGKYERVERRFSHTKPGTPERAYALSDPMEYFAESTEAFFGRNDFFPFTRDELQSHDPGMFALLVQLWGVPAMSLGGQESGAAAARSGGLMADSPVTFPKQGALPAKYPPDVKVQNEPAENDYYIFSSPCRSVEQIKTIQKEMPAGRFTPPPADWKPLERTRRILTAGGDLRILALGDSIINDTMRSGWVALLREAYPKADIQATVYVRGGGGCQHYREEDRVAKYVLPRKPDLVIIGGISQRDIESIREVIRQLRAGLPDVEILLTTGAFGTVDPRDPVALAQASHSGTGDYGRKLAALAAAEGCAYLDLTTPWAEYIVASGQHPHRFYRDVVHANEFGEQILAKAMMAFWTSEGYSEAAWLPARLEWFQDLKFGFMLHWAPYSQWGCIESWPLVEDDEWARPDDLPAWVERGRDMERFQRDYWALPKTFNPVKFDPRKWSATAKAAGMKYVVFTTKHHDGFSLFDTRLSDYRITAPDVPFHTHPRSNAVREVFNAFREDGFAIGVYFSKSDWHHPDYWDPAFPARSRNPNYDTLAQPEKWRRFVEFTHRQIEELMTSYGPADILWLDAGQVRPPRQDIQMDRLVAMARQHQPRLIVVDRTVGGRHENYRTPEQEVPEEPLPFVWETCMTMGDQWSFKPNDHYKSTHRLIHLLVDIVGKGGNFLLNVGPQPDGELPPVAVERLREIGAWMRVNGEAIYGTRAIAPYKDGTVVFTRKGRTVYAIYLSPKEGGALPATLQFSGLKPATGTLVSMLGVESPLAWQTDAAGQTTIRLPASVIRSPPSRHAVALKFTPASLAE